MASENSLPSYRICVHNRGTEKPDYAFLEPAEEKDMPSENNPDWTCYWQRLWQVADFEYEAIIKFTYISKSSNQKEILGLCRLGIFPFPDSEDKYFLDISNIETIQNSRPPIYPIGQWLIWYATKEALARCIKNNSGTIVSVEALEKAMPYYRSKVQMSEVGSKGGAPGEDIYVFRFTQAEGQAFCNRMEATFGYPVLLSSD